MSLQKEQAYMLYVEQGLDAKVVAEMIGISETTISRWNKKEQWRKLRADRITAPQKLATHYYRQCEMIVAKANNEKRVLTDKEAATISKLTIAIDNVGKPDNMRLYMHAMKAFILYLMRKNPDLGRQITDYQISFIKDILNKGPWNY